MKQYLQAAIKCRERIAYCKFNISSYERIYYLLQLEVQLNY